MRKAPRREPRGRRRSSGSKPKRDRSALEAITREEAIRLYTAANGWFLREEDKLGTIEEGKLGDVVVLSHDYFDRSRVPDDRLRQIHSVLTIVDGKVVHNLLD